MSKVFLHKTVIHLLKTNIVRVLLRPELYQIPEVKPHTYYQKSKLYQNFNF